MSIDIAFSSRVFVTTFDSGRTAPSADSLTVVTSINKIRDVLTTANWKMNRGIVGLGGITFPLGLPSSSTPIINGLNRFVCTLSNPASPAHTISNNFEPYTVPLSSTLSINVNGRTQNIPLTGGASLSADQVADDIAKTLIDAVPFVTNHQVGISTIAVGGGTSLNILSGNYFGWTGVDGVDEGLPLSYYFWNHNFEVTHPDFGPDAVWVDVATVLGALEELRLAIAGTNTAITALPDTSSSLILQALGGGPYSTLLTTAENGFQDLVGGTIGGGWQLRSRSQHDDDSNSNHDAHLYVNLTARSVAAGVKVEVFENSISRFVFNPQYTPTKTPFYIWANPYGLAMINDEPFHAGDIFVGNAFFHFTLTHVDVSQTAIVRSWFNMHGFACRDTIGVGNAFAQVQVLVDNGTEFTENNGFGQDAFALNVFHARNGSVLNRVGKPIFYKAQVFFRFSTSFAACLQGDFWDAFTVSDYFPRDQFIDQDGRTYIAYMCFSGDTSAPKGTVMLLWPRLASDPEPGSPDPRRPIKTGIVNVFGFGVTLISGDTFDASMIGNSFYIAGIKYVVSSFIDDHHLNLSTTAGIQPGVGYHT